jgi:cell division septum initiation protein DivIVA
VTDSRMKGRVKGLFGGAPPDADVVDQIQAEVFTDPDAQRQALQVLVLAQRTADDHVASAQHHADKIRADARAAAEQTAREAQAHADGARREAGKALSDARAMADQIVRDAQAHADGTRRDSDKVLSDARATAEQIAKDAQAKADDLERDAQQRYEDIVGSLAAKRAALEQQIDALQQFDRDYRARLRAFMQGQLRALGVDEPPSNGETQQPASSATPVPQTAQGR